MTRMFRLFFLVFLFHLSSPSSSSSIPFVQHGLTPSQSEVIFASLKIMLIIGLIIGCLVIDLGGGPNHERLGFRYWNDPGAFNEYIDTGSTGRFLAFWKVLLFAAFSFGNIQVVAISGSETRDPRRIIPAATRKTFFRVFFFYVLSILVVGMVVYV